MTPKIDYKMNASDVLAYIDENTNKQFTATDLAIVFNISRHKIGTFLNELLTNSQIQFKVYRMRRYVFSHNYSAEKVVLNTSVATKRSSYYADGSEFKPLKIVKNLFSERINPRARISLGRNDQHRYNAIGC